MMPWKEQFELGWRALRWLFWPADQKAWANIAANILIVTMMLAISLQLWLVLLAAFFMSVPVVIGGRKR